jgi:hypothetical protein
VIPSFPPMPAASKPAVRTSASGEPFCVAYAACDRVCRTGSPTLCAPPVCRGGGALLLQCPAAIAIAVGDLGRGVFSRAHPLFYEIRRRDNSDHATLRMQTAHNRVRGGA